jgi:hypothetical protein
VFYRSLGSSSFPRKTRQIKIERGFNTMKKVKEENHAKDQAAAQLESILEMVEKLGNETTEEEAREEIQNDALSVEIRSDWHSPGDDRGDSLEFRILLCTGGPAVQLVGELGKYKEPESVKLQYQDWFTPWTDYPLDSEEEEKVLTYCRQFYFGE